MGKARNPNHMKNLKPLAKGFDPRRNLKGSPKKLPALDVLMADLLGDETPEGKTKAQVLLDTLYEKAKKGDNRASEILLERGYGKVKQEIEQTGTSQVIVEQTIIERKVVSKNAKDNA